jgi:hypothetical protein
VNEQSRGEDRGAVLAAKKPPGRLSRLLGPALSPHGLLSRAVAVAAAFFICHLAGLRAYTTIISGTSPSGDPKDYVSAALGVLYVVFYVGVTMLVPALLIAAVVLAACFRLAARLGPVGGQRPARK